MFYFLTKIFRLSKKENKRYIPCLTAISKLSNKFKFAADKFILSCIHIDLLDDIGKYLSVYK
jgi:hypothetical protein